MLHKNIIIHCIPKKCWKVEKIFKKGFGKVEKISVYVSQGSIKAGQGHLEQEIPGIPGLPEVVPVDSKLLDL